MAKRSSWGATQEAYENSPLCAERRKNAELVGTLHRVAGHLGVVASVDAVSDWCAKLEKWKREEKKLATENTEGTEMKKNTKLKCGNSREGAGNEV